jgi:outer membrane protein assembly factor BamB
MRCGAQTVWAVGLVVVAVVVGTAAAAEWAQWQGPSRDNRSPDTGLLKVWPAGGPRLVWTGTGLGDGFSSVAIADGMIYITGITADKQNTVTAFDLAGNVKWRVKNGPDWTGDHPGSRATPTVDDGVVYVLSGMGSLGRFDAKTGTSRGSIQITSKFGGRPPTWGYAEAVLVDGDKVIVTPGGRRGAVVALDKKTAASRWAIASSDGASYCAPVVFEFGGVRQIATMTAKEAVGIAAETGTILWRYPHKTSYDVHATSLVFHDGYIYGTAGYGSGGFSLDLRGATGGARLSARWRDRNLDNHHGGVVLLDGHIYGYGDRGGWVCLDFQSGAVKYAGKSFGKGSLTYADGMLYCLSERGTMGLVPATPEGFQVVSSFRVPRGGGGPYWAHPVVLDGRLYLRHADHLYAYDVKAPQ